MDPASRENLLKLKQRYPEMDLEMVQLFSQTISIAGLAAS
jgi:hypothetical protein